MAAMAGMFLGAFIVSLLVAVVWLIIAKIVPPLKRQPKLSYPIAMGLALGIQLVNINGPSAHGLLAALACCGLLFLQMKRAQAKQTAANGQA